MTGKLASFNLRSTELNRRWYQMKKPMGNMYGGEKNICIGDYIEIILNTCRHSLFLQRDGLQGKIWVVSNTFIWNEEC